MPRAALILAAAAGLFLSIPAVAAGRSEVNPHMDTRIVPESCSACHNGHGTPRSPMLPASQKAVCLKCHDTDTTATRITQTGRLNGGEQNRGLAKVLDQPYTHPVDEQAFSSMEEGTVTCSSCHSPHRGSSRDATSAVAPGTARRSPKNPARLEYQMCQDCHGSAGATTRSLLDISRMLNSGNRSYHPVEATAAGTSPSVIPALAGREINCTDCHGNRSPSGARGPHGSPVRFILKRDYTTLDGDGEAAETYDLCYSCHIRQKVLDESPFPLHRSHVVDEQASCATCHSAHGSVENRALIRFGEETSIAGVEPSVSTQLLKYESSNAGTGTCFLTCHGYDHGPSSYGAAALLDTERAQSLRNSDGLRPSRRRGRQNQAAGTSRREAGGRVRQEPPL